MTGITEKDVHDIYMTRSMLEGLCARWAAEHISEEQIQEMEEVLLLTEYHLDRGNYYNVVGLPVSEFHEVLYDASQSRILRHILSDFHKYVQVARKRSVKKEDRAKKSLEEHREILNALRTGDADRAEELAHIHILNVMENLHIEQE